MENKKWLIDPNALKKAIRAESWVKERKVQLTLDFIDIIIDEQPIADAVEVVRCKDCKHWKPSGSMAGNTEYDLQPIGGCKWVNCCRKANDFCSYGERRTDNGKEE